MKQVLKAGLVMLACFGLNAAAQDWYHDRDGYFRGDQWHGHIFAQVRMDLDHIGSAAWASGKEQNRLIRTRQELGDLQGKLDHARYDGGELNNVISSLRKSANDLRLSPRDRGVLNDDLARLEDYKMHHDHWR
jgi:hypothetical protein